MDNSRLNCFLYQQVIFFFFCYIIIITITHHGDDNQEYEGILRFHLFI